MSKIRFSAALLSLAMLFSMAPLTVSAPATVSAATTSKNTNSIQVQNVNVTMEFDGVSMQPPVGQYVFIYNNTTYVPLRFMSYALKKSVAWDAKNVKVTVAEPSSAELVIIKEYLMNATNGNGTSVATKSVTLNTVKAIYVFNGSAKSVPNGQSSYLLNGSMYIPLRFLSESVGTTIAWNQKTKTITAASKSYQEQEGNTSPTVTPTSSQGATTMLSSTPKPSATPTASAGAAGGGSGGTGAGTDKLTYESITSATKAKLDALESQSETTLRGIAFEYIMATDETAIQSIKARGKEQLASFRATFNSIVADAEQQLKANGYSTDIISQYRSAFEAKLQSGIGSAKEMAK